MTIPHTPKAVRPGVIVIASSIEGIDALARLINQFPSTFPIPVVVQINGLWQRSIDQLLKALIGPSPQVQVLYARTKEKLNAGCVYVISDNDDFVFSETGMLALSQNSDISGADHLFKSAARWYGTDVIGVVLSGLGVNGTEGLRAIAKVNGKRVIQNPYEATFPSMPMIALIKDHVQHVAILNELGILLEKLSIGSETVVSVPKELEPEEFLQVLAANAASMALLEHSINAILRMIREEHLADIAYISQRVGNRFFISYATNDPEFAQLKNVSYHKEQSVCQRVLDGRLPAVIPDVETLRLTHDIPVFPVAFGTYMAALINLKDDTFYGLLCCIKSSPSPDLDQGDHQRLKISANHIAEIFDQQKDF